MPKVEKKFPETYWLRSALAGSEPRRTVTVLYARLHRCHLLKLGRGVANMAVQLIGENIEIAVVVQETAVHAAVIFVAHAVQGFGIDHRQRLHQHRMDQGEDGGVGADTERKREDDGDYEGG